ncbi:MAG: Rne/Rng family ribonuclease [Actinomycetota bacterium]
MSEPDRPDDSGPTTDTSTVEPARAAAEATVPDATGITTEGSAGATSGPAGNGSEPKKRRRRGSRGGRRRKKPAGAGGGPSAGARAPSGRAAGGGDDDDNRAGEDWTDPEADRGLTDDDIADAAREEAGLPPRKDVARPRGGRGRARGDGTPRIGDSRPAAAAPATTAPADGETAPKKRRRRRGGRGRGKVGTGGGGGGGGGGGTTATRAPRGTGFVDAGVGIADVDVDGTAILDSLDEETLERRRGSRRKGRPAGRYLMVVHERPDGIAHLAVLEGRSLTEHYVSTPTDDTTSIDGNIYLGRVQNVLPGMEAAFIDIGTPKNGVLYRGDVVYDESEIEGDERPRIERVLRNGQSIIVQVTKNPIGHKGARLTQEVSLAGRFVVMVPGQPQTYGISKRLPDDERRRLRRILDRLRPADAGLIVRTAAEGATDEELERDMRRLNAQLQQISELAKRARAGSLLYKEPALVIRLVREEFTKEYRGVVIDSPQLYEEVRGYVEAISPELVDRVEYYDAADENLPLFEKFHVHEQLHKALDRKVWLPSGGSIVVERTEALTVIDVNTGKNVGSSNLEETVYRNNLEAAGAVARELRLRDIGGIIVIDFIDMESKHNREAVEEAFRQALARDKTRTQVFPISELGLLEMTRKRVSEGLVETFSSTCPHCNGRGFVVDESMFE